MSPTFSSGCWSPWPPEDDKSVEIGAGVDHLEAGRLHRDEVLMEEAIAHLGS